MMSDTANEIAAISPSAASSQSQEPQTPVPVVMISRRDGAMIEQIVPFDNSVALPITLHFGRDEVECAVCREDMVAGCEVLKLPCRHVYHSGCIFSWLEKNTSCPMCRYKYPADTSAAASSSSTSASASSTYFN